nr:DrmE family protein [Paludibacter sp.]
ELADKILENSGKGNMRELATMWKESLEIWRMLSSLDSIDKIYKRLIDVGCTKNYLTVRGWLLDDDIIAPQQKEDLLHIAQVTEDDVLAEMIDQVFDAAREVKRAHTQAGKNLSELLKREIASALKEYGDIDPFNIWEPITMVLDGIGTIKILKVIDIGDIVVVDLTDTNRLVEER